MSKLRRLLNDREPAAGVIKEDYEDFVVEETPLYEPSGEGTHTYFRIEKAGLSTVQAAQRWGAVSGGREWGEGLATFGDR